MWQDLIIGVGQAILAGAMVPAIMSEKKPPLSSCLMTAAVLTGFLISYASLGLWWSVVAAGACAGCWYVLAWQQWERQRSPQTPRMWCTAHTVEDLINNLQTVPPKTPFHTIHFVDIDGVRVPKATYLSVSYETVYGGRVQKFDRNNLSVVFWAHADERKA